MEFSKLDSVTETLPKYCHLAGDEDFMEVTEWRNGDGFEIFISRKNSEQRFSLTYGEFELLTVLINIKKDKQNG